MDPNHSDAKASREITALPQLQQRLWGCPPSLHPVNTHLVTFFQLTAHTPAKDTQLTRASQQPGSFMHFRHSMCYKPQLPTRPQADAIITSARQRTRNPQFENQHSLFGGLQSREDYSPENKVALQPACGNSLQNISHVMSSHKSEWKPKAQAKKLQT